MTGVVPAFAAGQVQRHAERRAGFDPVQAQAQGARILGLWQGQVPLCEAGGLWLTAHGFPQPDPGDPKAEMIYLGQTPDLGEVMAQSLGDGDTPPDLPPGTHWADLRQAMLDMTSDEAELAATAKALLIWHRSHRFCSACGAPSTMAEAGWQRKCPDCQTAHFPRTDPVVIMLVTRGDNLLLGRSPGWPEGMYSTLAGFMEPGETVEAAVRREVAEETGIQIGRVRYLSSQPWPFPASLMLGCHAEALSDTITLDPAELEDALWVTSAQMVSILAGLHPTIKPMRRGAIAQSLVVNWLADRHD